MKPDFSYNLYIPPAARERLLTSLQTMCAPDDAAALTELQHDATRTDVNFSLVLPPEPSIRQFADWYPGPYRWDVHGMVRVGMIAAWLKPEPVPAWLEPQSHAGTATLCLRIWPVTSTVQVSCVRAPSFWHCLITLLERADGRWGLLDDSSGGPELPFWSHLAGRIPLSIPAW